MAKKPIVLIVDDEEQTLQLVAELLADDDYELRFAREGLSAIEQARQEAPDILVLDIVMPGMDGYAVARRFRNDPLLRHVPILLVTGFGIRESALEGLRIGAEDIIAKPFDMGELRLRIRTILRLNHFRQMRDERVAFEWAVEQSEQGYILLDEEDRIQFVNVTASRQLGLDAKTRYPDPRPSLLPLMRQRFAFIPDNAWSRWPKLRPDAYLVRPGSRHEPAMWLRVERLLLGAEAGPNTILRLRDETDAVIMRQRVWTFESLISHKLRTPLNGLIGSLDLLGGEDDPAQARDLLKSAIEATSRLNESIGAILDHFEQKPRLMTESLRVGPAVEDCLHALEQNLQLRSIGVSMAENAREVAVNIARTDLDAALHEGCFNARKFHPKGDPTLLCRITRPDESTIAVELVDDGRRVAAETLENLARPYFQEDLEGTGEVPGMGLGLSRVSTLLASYGGRLEVANREDRPGFRLRLLLPIISGQE